MTRKLQFNIRIPTTAGEYIPNNTEPVLLPVSDIAADIIEYLRKCGFTEKPLTRAYKLTFTAANGEIYLNDISSPEYLTMQYGKRLKGGFIYSHATYLMNFLSLTPKIIKNQPVLIAMAKYGSKKHEEGKLPLTTAEYEKIRILGNLENKFVRDLDG